MLQNNQTHTFFIMRTRGSCKVHVGCFIIFDHANPCTTTKSKMPDKTNDDQLHWFYSVEYYFKTPEKWVTWML